MSRKNKCRGCVWETRLNEIQQFCPFGSCVMKGGGNNGNAVFRERRKKELEAAERLKIYTDIATSKRACS